MKSRIEADESGDLFFTFPESMLASGQFLPGDDVDMQVKGEKLYIKNLSCPILRLSRFRRNLNSIIRNINNDQHPLKRVLITRQKTAFWCLPHDSTKWPEFFDDIKPSDEPKKG